MKEDSFSVAESHPKMIGQCGMLGLCIFGGRGCAWVCVCRGFFRSSYTT